MLNIGDKVILQCHPDHPRYPGEIYNWSSAMEAYVGTEAIITWCQIETPQLQAEIHKKYKVMVDTNRFTWYVNDDQVVTDEGNRTADLEPLKIRSEDEELKRQVAFFFGSRYSSGVR